MSLAQTTRVLKTPARSPVDRAGRLMALIVAGLVCTRAELDPDLWWHLRAGLDLLRIGHLTAADPYSFTQDVPWINHEWLSEIIMALAYRAGGVLGLVVMKSAILAAAFVLLTSATRRTAETARWWSLAAGFVAIAFAATTVRPQLWTLLAIAVLLRLLPSRRRLYTIPVLFALWANLHGGWIVGLAVAVFWLIGRLIDTRSLRAVMDGAGALAIATAATLINPYGWGLWRFLASTVRLTRNLTEWQPIWRQAELSAAFLWALVAIGIVGTTLVSRWRSVTWAAALPVGWLAAMSLLVARIVPLFGEVAAVWLADAWSQRREDPAPARRPVALLAVDTAFVAAVCVFNVTAGARCLTTERSWVPDVEAASALSASDLRGRLVLPYDWGSFALWHWGPGLRVSIDPRRETVYSEATVATQSAIRFGRPEGLDFLGRYRPEYVWEPTTASATEEWLRGNGYNIDIRTNRSFVARRSDLPALHTGPPMSRCFP